MKARYLLVLLAVLFVAGALITIYILRNPGGSYEQPEAAEEFDQSHAAFDRVLKAHVKDAKVDYAAIKGDPADLDAFLKAAAAVRRADFDQWTKAEQLALLIDVYNAATIRIVIDNYPLESIKDIGNAVIGAWQKPVVQLFGEKKTLDNVEHDMIRADYDDPRIHFALVCAAVSCPPLRGEAFVGEKLDAQLDDQGKIFLADEEKNYVSKESKTAHLSKIFDWYGGDFTGDGKPLLEALSPWMPPAAQELVKAGDIEVQFNDYDWSLNDAK